MAITRMNCAAPTKKECPEGRERSRCALLLIQLCLWLLSWAVHFVTICVPILHASKAKAPRCYDHEVCQYAHSLVEVPSR
jgi:hypothetical protein